MRVLILSHWYQPEPVAKPHQMAKELVARGHQVTSITGFPNYPSGRVYPGYRLAWRLWEERNGVHVLRLPMYPNHSKSGIRRALNLLSFASSAAILGPVLSAPADVIWVYDALMSGIPARWIGWWRRAPFIYEVQDMWPETLTATGMLTSDWMIRCVSRVAHFVYARAAAVTVISPGFKRNLVSKGVVADKIHVIPNWANEDVYRPLPPDPALAIEHGLAGRFNVIYGGNLGAAQALRDVIKAAELLQDLPQVQFVLIGDGVEELALRQMVKELGLDNVRFLGRQPAERMPYFFALADALLVHLKRNPLFEITIPSKTVAYLACGRPIVSCVEGDAAQVVQNAGAGLVCPSQDPAALAQAVRDLYAMPVEQREAMGQSGRQAFLENYTRAVLMDRYEALFTDIAKQYKDGKTPLEKRSRVHS
jgi:colanic acid biosynthesis glycosyl transferase WcaI